MATRKRQTIYLNEKTGNWMGEFPHDPMIGFVADRRGIRRILCSDIELKTTPESIQAQKLQLFYKSVELSIRNKVEDDRKKLEKVKREKKLHTIKQASNEWFDELEVTVSEGTLKEYKRTVNYYIKGVGNHEVRLFDRSKNISFLDYLQTVKPRSDKPMSKDTQNKHMRQLQVFINWAYEHEYIKKHIQLKRVQKSKKDIDSFDLNELETLKAHIVVQLSLAIDNQKQAEGKRQKKEADRKVVNYKNLLRAFLLCQHTLMRLGAMWSLKLEKIVLSKRHIKIESNPDLDWLNKKDKWPLKPINDDLFEILKQDLKNRPPNQKYFLDDGNGNPWFASETSVSHFFADILADSGLPKIRKPFHWGLRGSMCTLMLVNGTNPFTVQQLMDHDNIQTTMGYLNTRKVKQTEGTDALQAMIRNQSDGVKTDHINLLLKDHVKHHVK